MIPRYWTGSAPGADWHDPHPWTGSCWRGTPHEEPACRIPSWVFSSHPDLSARYSVATTWRLSCWPSAAAPTILDQRWAGATASTRPTGCRACGQICVWSLCWLSCHPAAHRGRSYLALQRSECCPPRVTMEPMRNWQSREHGIECDGRQGTVWALPATWWPAPLCYFPSPRKSDAGHQ